jgi:hypothetical protein
MRLVVRAFIICCAAASSLSAAESVLTRSEELYAGWLQMYDLKFDEAHQTFGQWSQSHPADSLGPASDAAAYLFSELARLGALESELFVDDARFAERKQLLPDAQVKEHFIQQINRADELANATLQKSAADADALFVKSLTCGLRANYAALIEKQNLAALSYTKQGRPFADKLLSVDPNAFDAYLGPGIENYLLSLKSAPIRFFLRLTGSKVDREKGLEQLQKTALHGFYFEPFAKLLLAVAALRDNNREHARELLAGLHGRFPENKLYEIELERLKSGGG